MWEIRVGDVLDRLREMPDESVHMCVTSPPYWGLRDYGTAEWDGGDAGCDHRIYLGGNGAESAKQTTSSGTQFYQPRDVCGRCGARRIDQQIGLEPTPEEWVARLVKVFREVRRVLRSDGTCWINLGDSYNTGTSTPSKPPPHEDSRRGGWEKPGGFERSRIDAPGLKPKDLVGQPWMLAFALRADGWYLRSEIIWHKPNPMPESVTDRPTKAHEQVFLLSKAARYFYDAEAIREPAVKGYDGSTFTNGKTAINGGSRVSQLPREDAPGRNARSVWTIPTQPFPEAHFACADDATEVLTQRGWKCHDELVIGEAIAGYSLQDQRLRWRPLDDVARYSVVDQPMVYAEGQSLDMALTPNHRTIIQRRHPATRLHQAPTIIRADELRTSHAIPTTGEWDETGEPFDERWAELLGWYIAEGHEAKKSLAVEIYQSMSANPQHVARIRELLYAVGAEWNEATGARTWRGRPTTQVAFRIIGYAAARLRELAPAKELAPFVLSWSDTAIKGLMAGLINGDGHTRADGRMSFIQRNKGTADLVQALAIRLGWSAALRPRQSGNMWTVYFTRHNRRSLRGTAGRGAVIDQRPYTGIVWCPRTVDGTWVARRNGYVFVTGNTFPEELPRRCIQAGTSEHGCCAECGAPWTRVVERESIIDPRPMTTGAAKKEALGHLARTTPQGRTAGTVNVTTTGWQPTCTHQAPVVPCTVLDPFSGSGTTIMVALQLGRSGIGIELNPDYAEMARRRILADHGAVVAPNGDTPAGVEQVQGRLW